MQNQTNSLITCDTQLKTAPVKFAKAKTRVKATCSHVLLFVCNLIVVFLFRTYKYVGPKSCIMAGKVSFSELYDYCYGLLL